MMLNLLGLFLVALYSLTLAEPVNDDDQVCNEWVDPFFEIMVLNEDRPAKYEDLRRIFTIMDVDGNDLVSEAEFEPPWRQLTMMTLADTETLFAYWAIRRDTSDPLNINEENILGIWDYFDPDETGLVDQETFSKVWTEQFLPDLPNKGCSDNGKSVNDVKLMHSSSNC